MQDFYALILAGGSGSRLWPLSQPGHPKALLSFLGSRSMFQHTLDRLAGLFSPDRIFVVAAPDLCGQLYGQAPQIPIENFIHEQARRNSGPALALGLLTIAERCPSAVVAVFSIDNVIDRPERLHQALNAAFQAAQADTIVTLGVPATRPETRFGYIQCGDLLGHLQDFSLYDVQGFVEKPHIAQAVSFMVSGDHYWDSGMLVLSAQYGLTEFKRQQPHLLADLRAGQWECLPSLSLDYAIVEHAQALAMLVLDVAWQDIGNWDAVFNLLPKDQHGNVSGPCQLVLNSHDTFVRSQRKTIVIGVDNLLIVDTEDGLLICKRGHSDELGAAVSQLQEQATL